ncbi:monooxygenase [Cadophora gregata]|uniref:monooxygenase n=1 Tax=Cadophora gregata TaxID=51156 RepID=UPI0026DCE758|nr:monooxygenase [Cadophora gregata]KAK0111257.1 monooxygenase [Cadophora gregata]
MATKDLIVVGAGPFGLIAAYTWLELNPDDVVTVLEAGPDLGGVWSKSRTYPTMMTQTPADMLGYSCYPMPSPPKEESFYDLFPGHHVTLYLEAFSMHKAFAGKTIKDRIIFDSPVSNITKMNKSWNVETSTGKTFNCKKLIIAAGLTSTPNIPSFPIKDFKPPIIHTRDLAANTPLLSSPEIKSVLVIGGSKSAFDTVVLLSSLKKSITWAIRTTGQGPALPANPDAPWPLSNSHEIISTRLVSKMSPCIFEPLDGLTRFFHCNSIGIKLVDMIWSAIDGMWRKTAGYGRSDSMRNLTPDRPVFYFSDGAAVYNKEGLWDIVATANALRDDVVSMEGKEVLLKSGKRVECDAVVTATGWSNIYPFFKDDLAKKLGLPVLPDTVEAKDVEVWEARISEAHKIVTDAFPRLTVQPNFPHHTPKATPGRLYRHIAPISDQEDRSIVFLGTIGTTQSFLVAEVQALWATAYLSGSLSLPGDEKMRDEVALATAWRRRRYVGDGYTFIYEQLPYMSMLIRDLGLNDLRKGGGWREILSPYKSADFRGLLDEWRIKNEAVDGDDRAQ